jgi:hypothetical protein
VLVRIRANTPPAGFTELAGGLGVQRDADYARVKWAKTNAKAANTTVEEAAIMRRRKRMEWAASAGQSAAKTE